MVVAEHDYDHVHDLNIRGRECFLWQILCCIGLGLRMFKSYKEDPTYLDGILKSSSNLFNEKGRDVTQHKWKWNVCPLMVKIESWKFLTFPKSRRGYYIPNTFGEKSVDLFVMIRNILICQKLSEEISWARVPLIWHTVNMLNNDLS